MKEKASATNVSVIERREYNMRRGKKSVTIIVLVLCVYTLQTRSTVVKMCV